MKTDIQKLLILHDAMLKDVVARNKLRLMHCIDTFGPGRDICSRFPVKNPVFFRLQHDIPAHIYYQFLKDNGLK